MFKAWLKKHKKGVGIFGIVGSFSLVFYIFVLLSFGAVITIILTAAQEADKDKVVGGDAPQAYKGQYFNLLHEQLVSMNFSKIPDDAALDVPQDTFTVSGWTLKDYMSAYMLACEICARGEINPNLESPDIYPEDLLGSWMMETHMAKGADAEGFEGTYCKWIECTNSFGFMGPFQQTPTWYNLSEGKDTDFKGALYVSWMENPDLDPETRAVFGTPYMLKNGQGVYINAGSYQSLKDGGKKAFNMTATAESLHNSIKVGMLGESSTQQRPYANYLPDAMYTLALHLRLGLDGRTANLNVSEKNAYGNAKVINLMPNASDSDVMSVRKALVKDVFSSNYDYLTVGPSYDSTGTVALTYLSAAVTEGIGFYPVDKLPASTVRTYLNAGTASVYQILFGTGVKSTSDESLVLGATDGVVYALENCGTQPGSLVTRARVSATRQSKSAIKSQIFYGFSTAQAGRFVSKSFEAICTQAVTHEEWKYKDASEIPGNSQGTGDTATGNTLVCSGNQYCACKVNGVNFGKAIRPGYSISVEAPNEGVLCPAQQYPIEFGSVKAGLTYSGHGNCVDFPARTLKLPSHSPVHAAADGVVVIISANNENTRKTDQKSLRAFGNFVGIRSQQGVHLYLHMSSFAHVYPGMHVKAGDVIGYMGNTGNSTAEHLHFEASANLRVSFGTTLTASKYSNYPISSVFPGLTIIGGE